ncbi:MAG: AroM family protein [Candidatus Acetothermia bacterium]|jgi:protein AroM|nr:AroM family protein [Candidatus Acetothermia bacterium]
MKRIALVTIGQAPRDDVVPEIRGHLPPEVEVVQAGALDGLTVDEIAAHPPLGEESTLVTRLSDGREVTVHREFVHHRLEEAIRAVEKDVVLIGILCSGTFPPLRARVPVVVPHVLVRSYVSALALPGPLGILVPSPRQVAPTVEEVRGWGVEAIGASVSPYTGRARLGAVARGLAERGATAFLLHCFGYSERMKGEVRAATGAPVLLVRSMLARALAELV